MNLAQRLPNLQQVAPVYAVIVMIIYPWSILHFFWRLPSLTFYSSVSEIMVIFAYLVVVNFVESILVLLAPVTMSVVLPYKWFYNRFVTRGVLLVSLGLGYLVFFDKQLQQFVPFPYDLAKWTPAVALPILVFVYLLDGIGFLRRILEELADRLTVFLYLSIPLSIISVLTVLVRNLI